jgi:hypothetical protein
MKFLKLKTTLAALSVGAVFALSGAASAATYTMGSGKNECGAGGFSSCSLNGSPSIFKMNFDGSTDKNTSFASITGSEFTFAYSDGNRIADWTYTLGANDPGLTAVVVKAGSAWAFTTDGWSFANGVYTGQVSTKDAGLVNINNGKGRKISHITFFDTAVSPVPLPAAGWMLLAGLGGIAAMKRRKKA